MNEINPLRLIDLHTQLVGYQGRIGRCGFVGLGEAFVPLGWALKSLLPAYSQDVKPSAMASAPLKLPHSQWKAFFPKSCLGHGVSLQQQQQQHTDCDKGARKILPGTPLVTAARQ